MKIQQKKWEDRYRDADIGDTVVAAVLEENSHLLSSSGQGLDLACGKAGNAQFLAKRGYRVDAFDLSGNVIEALKRYISHHPEVSSIHSGAIHPKVWDSEKDPLRKNHYDVIIASYFLQRNLFPAMIDALKAGGLLFYQTWSEQSVDSSGPKNPDFRLKQGELLSLCSGMRIVLYREDGQLGEVNEGHRNEAWVIAEKR